MVVSESNSNAWHLMWDGIYKPREQKGISERPAVLELFLKMTDFNKFSIAGTIYWGRFPLYILTLTLKAFKMSDLAKLIQLWVEMLNKLKNIQMFKAK